ncbi:60S ribosome subunit biogenesis protein NIP7 homolog [Acomys russatus]|uniref:60S ribosome subunit biogenesis protein NIP7 homolog n=1 Tax=Acomys russatus TaxID=60746 RepID=UPI0021E2D6AA|nr:60S ribosome subunit biogenesis protein NIP7 homolog [Acomys russatus]
MTARIVLGIGENLQLLVDRPDSIYCFWLKNDQVYYVREMILKLDATISGDKLVSRWTCLGKFTKTRKFQLFIRALDYIEIYAKFLGSSKATKDCRKMDPMALVVFHQADIGEYVQHEETWLRWSSQEHFSV